jgi:hypothetical protein
VTKGSTTCDTSPAFLLQQLSTIRRNHRFDILACYTPGDTNKIADCCSWFFHLSDMEFLAYMNHTYPVQPCWQLVTPPSEIKSVMNLALLRQPPPPVSRCPDPTRTTPPGTYGNNSASNYTLTQPWPTSRTLYHCYNSLLTDTEQAPWLPAALRSAHERWKEPFVPWARRSPHWATITHGFYNSEN